MSKFFSYTKARENKSVLKEFHIYLDHKSEEDKWREIGN